MMWWWPFGAVFMIVCMVMMFRMMGGHGMSGSRRYESERERPDAERILANRLASGEIDCRGVRAAPRRIASDQRVAPNMRQVSATRLGRSERCDGY